MEKAVITCGGTGGHFYPGLALARQLQQESCQVKLLLSGIHSAVQQEIARKFDVPAQVLPTMPSPGKSPRRWWQFLSGLAGGYFQARRALRELHPDYVIGMGSFASLPVVLAACELKIPIFLHDGNARIGKANRYLSRVARSIGTAFPAVNASCVKCPCFTSGMPVRPELVQQIGMSRSDALANLNANFAVSGGKLEPDRFTLLIFGGSQGAAIFNQVLPQVLTALAGKYAFQVLHLTGKGKLEETLTGYQTATFPRIVVESDQRMAWFLAAADLAVTRSGGSTVAELALFGKPAILIPYPYAAEGHQSDNARYYEQSGAATLVNNADFSPERAGELLQEFFSCPERLKKMHRNAASAARPGAAAQFLQAIRADLAQH